MKMFACAVLLAVTACSHIPTTLDVIHRDVGQRIAYQPYTMKDWRYVHPSRMGKGNCAVFAMTYSIDALRAGYTDVERVACTLPSGEGHAYTRVGVWALDNRYAKVIPVAKEDCK